MSDSWPNVYTTITTDEYEALKCAAGAMEDRQELLNALMAITATANEVKPRNTASFMEHLKARISDAVMTVKKFDIEARTNHWPQEPMPENNDVDSSFYKP